MAITLPVTVAVCTYQRPRELARALTSLLSQDPAAAELLVVDNSADQSAVKLVAQDFPGVRAVSEPIAGLDFARNRALASATQSIVLFLDDDAVAADGWVEASARPFFADTSVGAVTGRVEPLTLESEGQKLFEANGGFSRGDDPVRLPADAGRRLHGKRAPLIAWAVSIGSGCSLAVRRDAVRQIGGFDPALDLGAALPGGGDHDIMWRLLQSGYHVLYEPAAVARHEHRKTLADAKSQIVGHQRALIALLTKHLVQADGSQRWPVAGFLAWRLVKPGVRLVRRLDGRDPLPLSLLLRMWANCWLGLIAYPRARALARRRAAGATA
jgi:GT2 family glycosyltransferase